MHYIILNSIHIQSSIVVDENKKKKEEENHCGNLKAHEETYLQFTISVRVVRIHVSVGIYALERVFILYEYKKLQTTVCTRRNIFVYI